MDEREPIYVHASYTHNLQELPL